MSKNKNVVKINHDNFTKGTIAKLHMLGVDCVVSDYCHDGQHESIWCYPVTIDGKQVENSDKNTRAEVTHNSKSVFFYVGLNTALYLANVDIFTKAMEKYARKERYYSPKKEIALQFDRQTFIAFLDTLNAVQSDVVKDAVKDAETVGTETVNVA